MSDDNSIMDRFPGNYGVKGSTISPGFGANEELCKRGIGGKWFNIFF